MALPIPTGSVGAAIDEARKTGKSVSMRDIGRRMREAPAGETPESPPEDETAEPSSGSPVVDESTAESSSAPAEKAEAAPAKRRGKGSDARIQQLLSERKQMRRELDQLRRDFDTIRTGSARQSREDTLAELLGTAPTAPAQPKAPAEGGNGDAVAQRLQKATALAAVNLARDEIEDDYPDVDSQTAREASRFLAAARLRGMAMTPIQALAAARATLDDQEEEGMDAPDDDAGEVPAQSRSTRSSPVGKTGVTRTEHTPDAKSQREINDIRKQLSNARLHPANRTKLNARLWQLTGNR